MQSRFKCLGALMPAFPGVCLACACGCGVFDVGTSAMFASHAGAMIFAEYDFMDQSRNWSGSSAAPAAGNGDRDIRSSFMTAGGQYQFNRSWGLLLELPYWQRYFQRVDDLSGGVVESAHGAIGDIRIKATYTGLSADMSSGLTLGVKLANGETNYPGFDADTQIGSGSTDLLLGGYRLGRLSADGRWSYFLQALWDLPFSHKSNYRPGAEGAGAAGIYFEGWSTQGGVKFTPVAQLRFLSRRPDGGPDASPDDSGYSRLVASPGLEIGAGRVRVYADVALPVYTDVRGNQLVAGEMWKLNASYRL